MTAIPHAPSAEQAFFDGLDKKPWNAADRLRSNLDAAVYKHAVLSLNLHLPSAIATLRDTLLPELLSGEVATGN